LNVCWRGAAGGEVYDECWTAAAGGSRMGVFRITRGGKTTLRMAMLMEESPAGPRLHIQYLNQALADPPGRYFSATLASRAPRDVVFENPELPFPRRLLYRVDDGSLLIRLEGEVDGKGMRTDYVLQRAPVVNGNAGWPGGCWRGSGPSREFEECWTAAEGGSRIGVFRMARDGKTTLREAILLEDLPAGQVMTVQHYQAGFTRPHGKATGFPLARSAASEWVFENRAHDFPQRIVYRLGSDGELLARIEGERGGKPAAVDFPMKPARP